MPGPEQKVTCQEYGHDHRSYLQLRLEALNFLLPAQTAVLQEYCICLCRVLSSGDASCRARELSNAHLQPEFGNTFIQHNIKVIRRKTSFKVLQKYFSGFFICFVVVTF